MSEKPALPSAVLTEVHDRVLVITLNRPDARNAMNSDLTVGVLDALARLDSDDSLALGVLAGNGRGFCAGMDLKAFRTDGPPRGIDRLLSGVARKPLVAAVEGFAYGGGLELALTADLIVAGRSTKFALSEVKVGLFAGGGGLLRLPRAIPERVAMQVALTGEPITAEDALRWGLVNSVVDDGAALDGALDLAARVGANAPLALAASKELIHSAFDLPADQFWVRQRELFKVVSRSSDASEGARAFVEKRPPEWRGR